jgi:MFS family permease
MARERQRSLPPPAPPAERTAGQLVGEAMRLYGRRFWIALLLGVPPTLAGIAITSFTDAGASRAARLVIALAVGAPAVSASYVGASVVASGRRRPPARTLLIAFVAGLMVLLPVPFLATLLVLPALAWFALFGLAVPVAVAERLELTEVLRRALQLSRADFVHALGSLAAAAIVVFLSAGVLQFLLVQFGETASGVAAFIAILLLSPLLLFAAALLYDDQAARVAPGALREGLTSPRARRGK